MYRNHLGFFAREFPPNELFQSHDDDFHRFLELGQWKRPKNEAKPEALAYLDEHFSHADTLLAVGEGVLDARALYQCIRSNGRPVVYFAPSHCNLKLQSPNALWGSFVYQLLSQAPYLFTHVEALSKAMSESSARTTKNIAKLFQRLLAKMSPSPVEADKKVLLYVLVENLPSHDPKWKQSVDFLHSLQDTDDAAGLEENFGKPALKLALLYDRPAMAKLAVGDTPWAEEKVIDPVSIFGKETLRKFAEALVAVCPSKEYRAQYQSLILDQCGYDAEQIYGLRAIAEKDHAKLDPHKPDSIPKVSIWQTLTHGVESAFRLSPAWAKVAIGWLVYAKRPLTQEELRSAVQLSSGNHSILKIVATLKAGYGALIHATSKRICFPSKTIHGYFRDCLSKEQERLGADWPKLQIPDGKAIADVLVRCIAVKKGIFRLPDNILSLRPYAIDFWREHLEDAPVDLLKILSLIENTDFMSAKREMDYDLYWAKNRRTKSLSMEGPLVLAAQVGISSIVVRLAEDVVSAREIGSAIAMAARYNRADIVDILLSSNKLSGDEQAGDAIDAALEIAAVHNCSAVFKSLLSWMRKSADLRSHGIRMELLSHVACHAAKFGYLELLKLLVQSYGAQVDMPIDGVMKPLRQAVYYGNVGCVKFLVQEAGAIIYEKEAPTEDDKTNDTRSSTSEEGQDDANPVLVAAEQGFTDIVTVLLDETVVQIDGHTNGESTASSDASDTDDVRSSRKKSIVSWSIIEDAMIGACRQADIETVKHILRHPTVAAVPRSHRPSNNDLLCSALRADIQPGVDSLAMLIFNTSKPAERSQDLVHSFVCAAEFGQLEFIKHCLELDDPNAATAFTNGSASDDRMALHSAAGKGHIEIVRCLLEHGADPNVSDGTSFTPLALAAVAGHVETVRLLLTKGADVAWVGPTRGILALAAMSRRCELEVGVIHLLLQFGASVNTLDGSKHTALHWAAQRGHINILEALLAQDGVDVTITGDRDMNALHSAAQSPARTALLAAEMLIAAGISTQKTDVDGWLPLHLAACWNGVDLMQFLLGNDKNARNARATNGDTVLHAAYKTCEVLIWLIDQGFDVDMENNAGRTVLMHAAKNGVDESVGLLLAFGANTDLLDRSNRSALHHAVEARNVAVANKLLDANPAVLFQLDSSGTSVLYTAITRSLMPFVLRVLKELEKYANKNHIEDEMVRVLNAETTGTQRSPLLLAARRGDMQVVEKMVELGADIEKRDYTEATALIYAIQRNNEPMAKILLEAHLRVSKARGHGDSESKTGDKDKKNRSTDDRDPTSVRGKAYPAPLQSAAMTGNIDMVKLLLSYGVDVNEESGQFNTALTGAAAGGFSQVVSLLLDHKAETLLGGGSYPNALSAAVSSTSAATIDLLLARNKSAALARDVQGRNALHVAVQSRALDAFEKILSVAESLSDGGDLMPFGTALDPDKQGRRLLHFAASSGDVDMLKYFLEHPRLQLKNEIDILDNDGWTPLHWVCRLEEGAEAVQLLLEFGSDPSQETRDGWTPLNIAQYHAAADTVTVITAALRDRAEEIAERNASKRFADEGKVAPEATVQFENVGKPLAPGFSNWGVSCDGCFLMVGSNPPCSVTSLFVFSHAFSCQLLT